MINHMENVAVSKAEEKLNFLINYWNEMTWMWITNGMHTNTIDANIEKC